MNDMNQSLKPSTRESGAKETASSTATGIEKERIGSVGSAEGTKVSPLNVENVDLSRHYAPVTKAQAMDILASRLPLHERLTYTAEAKACLKFIVDSKKAGQNPLEPPTPTVLKIGEEARLAVQDGTLVGQVPARWEMTPEQGRLLKDYLETNNEPLTVEAKKGARIRKMAKPGEPVEPYLCEFYPEVVVKALFPAKGEESR